MKFPKKIRSTFFFLMSSSVNLLVTILGLVERIAIIMVIKQMTRKTRMGKISFDIFPIFPASMVIMIEIMIALTDIRIFDLLSAMEFRLI
jgi:hypothetical protein